MGTLYPDVIDARVTFPRDGGVMSRVYCDDHLLYISARSNLPMLLGSIPEAGWVERPLAFPGTEFHRIQFLLNISFVFGLRGHELAGTLSGYSFEELGAIVRRGWVGGGSLVHDPPVPILRPQHDVCLGGPLEEGRWTVSLQRAGARVGWPRGGSPDPVSVYTAILDASPSGYGFQVVEE